MTIRTSQLQYFEELLVSNNDGEDLAEASCVFIASVDDELLDYIDAIYEQTENAGSVHDKAATS